ncbi:MAG: SGNH/GDSL hydrolase family protein [Actinomycetia bacterium]|nr:SGNH/GDSL hydrolase family protein [Actinomycetes bacterium]MCH9700794.1 SGNH/GDSL hydrolase family protein [Actinomycetes bacterium]MCH9760994.1 SGNH/GDSL hydrolase family protein [Actinomycetes bacterium]
MSRLSTLALSLALLFGVLHAQFPVVQRHDVRLADYAVNRIAVIGDSYTAGGEEGGIGARGWPSHVWRTLAQHGIAVTPTVAAESGSGYCTRGDRGSVYEDLTVRAVRPTDRLVVFFGSRNDMAVDPTRLSVAMYGTFRMARQIARSAKFLVIGPAWPTADPPPAVRRIRDVLGYQAELAGATFVDPLAARWFVGTRNLIGEDGVHPTDAGHVYLAGKIAPLIGTQLNPY